MADLIRALVQVKTPVSLFAFVGLVLLMAFRTKRVPELFFGLAKEKLTKERFAQLLHRFMLFAFAGFVLLIGAAVLGQVLAIKTQARPLSLDDLRDELKSTGASEGQKQEALKQYADGLAYIQQHDLLQAIQALQKSVDAIPTLSAQTTLAYLYQRQGDQVNANKYAAAAQSLADQRGDSLAQVRLEQLSAQGSAATAPKGMVGDKKPFPEGGKSFEAAVTISPGLYVTTHRLEGNTFQYFKARLKAGQTLRIDFRTPDDTGDAGAAIYDADGAVKESGRMWDSRSELKTVQWTAPTDGIFYLSIGGWYGTSANVVYRISIQ